jgi:hypothetical protein
MSTLFRKTLICLIAVFALGALTASAASADIGQTLGICKKQLTATFVYSGSECQVVSAGPGTTGEYEIEPAVKKKFTSISGPGVLAVAGTEVKCKKDKNKGEITSTTTVGKVEVTFEECKVKGNAKECALANIATTKLKGELGEGAPEEDASEVAVLFEPEEGTTFATIPATECNVETKVTGKIAGEINRSGANTEYLLAFGLNPAKKQRIKTFERSAGDAVVAPSLKAFGLEATEETNELILFEEKLWLGPGV